ncbi:DUF1643 domain-containing protein [Pseudalkalibacillus berkeleyi]|uniref:DUF1643 domain-containing protein n=1 Tax=Pseudalkalibacillus berkeleyi TaxID=1069813 RepID=A0ABS9H2A6_9BACL|nr:DUF1643 domain-containing protein [Pseudalkalibacillus berkeleyi]MCF6139084.1 DUF1643 domain-containing protein [Pseudalkalibacillus berkeleyi]
MWPHILGNSGFKKVVTKYGTAITSKKGTKRYYYWEGDPDYILILFNASTADGDDETVRYLREFHPNFSIVNLIPTVAGKPEKLTEKDYLFDQINFQVIEGVLNETNIPVWIGWGELIKKKTRILLPKEFRELLTQHKERLVQIERGKPGKWFPMHPAFAKINIPVQELKLARFDVKYVLNYD